MRSPKTSDEATPPSPLRFRLMVGAGTLALVAGGLFLVARAAAHDNDVALVTLPKDVSVVEARATSYRPHRRYVATVEPWIETKVGPQLISAYVDTVLVRPGDVVKRGQIVATLDCRNASAASRAVSMQARALQAQQTALAHEAARVAELEHGGFASPNEIEKRGAESAAKAAELMESEAQMQRASREVSDCVLRAPFAGEVATRTVDPGAFVRPGMAVASLIDRATVRVVAEVPEGDFPVVAPGAGVSVRPLAALQAIQATISRRSPAADLSTRTVHVEIDVPDQARALPVGTTAEVTLEVGEPQAATALPLVATAIRGEKATVFVEKDGLAHKAVYPVLGERGGQIFLGPALAAGSHVITEGRALLRDGDHVHALLVAWDGPGPTPVRMAGARP